VQNAVVEVLSANPLLLLFLVAAVGYPLGLVRIRGGSLGVAAVLFVGLAAGALDPRLRLPEIVYVLGLALFVYTVGLASGPAFLASLRRDGIRNNLLAVGVLVLGAAVATALGRLLGLGAARTAGLFAGGLTNTPALAAALETLKRAGGGAGPDDALALPVVAYSISYPFGVIGVVLAIGLARRAFRVSWEEEAKTLGDLGGNEPLGNRTVRVVADLGGETIERISRRHGWNVIFGRIRRDGQTRLAGPGEALRPEDLVTVVGTDPEVAKVVAALGEVAAEAIDLDRTEFDMRRIFASSPEVVGRRIRELRLRRRFEAVITRVRRGDADLLPRADMVLEPGDRVRVLAHVTRMPAVTAFFGDSYRAVSEVDILTFSLGLALGLALGVLPIPLPGGVRVSLGFAGGPLVVALVLGILGRTGPMVWTLPYSANLTLRQIGLVFFLAGVGTRAGQGFLATFSGGAGFTLFAAGAAITAATAFSALAVGHRLLGIPLSLLAGMVAGIHTQPAVLGYALQRTRNDVPNVGYASVYPAATLAKILLAQLLLLFA
jgi:putative transport protein